jgi:2-methylcitrate dehydratase PrpD
MDDDPEAIATSFAASLSLDAIPADVLDRARLVVADTLAAVVGGIDLDPIASLADAWTAHDGPASVPTVGTTSVLRASLLNGTAGTALEIDPGHKLAGGHPATYLLPALLADAEAEGHSGRALLAGFVAGYEICARTGLACDLARGYHPHGVWGAVGAATAVSRARAADADRTLSAARIAAAGAQHGRFEAALDGVATAYAGVGNQRGLVAADQAAAGFEGLDRGIVRHLAQATGEGGVDATALADGLGEHWELARGYFKVHAACRFVHPTLDAVGRLADEHGIDSEDVRAVTVETYPIAARLDEPRPRNPHQAKFSVPFAVATRLLRGRSDKAAFGPQALTEGTFDLARRVSVVETDEMADRVPDARSARVTVQLRDGDEHVAEVRHARGSAENPVSEAELRTTYDDLVGPGLGTDEAADLWRAVQNLPDTDPRAIGQLLRGA